MAMNKAEQRKFCLAQRKQLSDQQRGEENLLIGRQVLQSKAYQKAQQLFCYVATPYEVATDEILIDALKQGKKVCVPYITDASQGTMVAARLTDMSQLVAGRFGIRSLAGDSLEVVEPEALDLILAPGVAFDRHCNRIGMGGGYYDRFLVRAMGSKCCCIGLAFTCQLLSELQTADFDQKVDMVITPSDIFIAK